MINQEAEVKHNLNYLLKGDGATRTIQQTGHAISGHAISGHAISQSQVMNVKDMPRHNMNANNYVHPTSDNWKSFWSESNFVSSKTLGAQVDKLDQQVKKLNSSVYGVQSLEQPIFSLDRIIEENPTLTGLEAKELLKKSIEVENLKYKSELQDKLVELSQLENLYYKFKSYNEVVIGKVVKFTIEYNVLYIYMDCITRNSNKISVSTEPLRYDYNYFCGLDVSETSSELYKNMLSYFLFVENNLK